MFQLSRLVVQASSETELLKKEGLKTLTIEMPKLSDICLYEIFESKLLTEKYFWFLHENLLNNVKNYYMDQANKNFT